MMTRLFVSMLAMAGLATAQNFFPIKDVRPGMHGVGRSVFQGERIEEFQVEILGVVDDLAPHQTIVIAR